MNLTRAVIKSKKLILGTAFLGAALFSIFLLILAKNQKTYMMEADYLIWAVLFCFILTNNDEIELIRVTEKSIYQVVKANISSILGIAFISEFIIRFGVYLMDPAGLPITTFLKGFLSYVITLLFYSGIAVFCRMVWKNQYISLTSVMFMYVCQYILHIAIGSAYIVKLQNTGAGGMNNILYNILRLLDANIFSFWNQWTDIWWQNRACFLLMGVAFMLCGLRYTQKHDISIK